MIGATKGSRAKSPCRSRSLAVIGDGAFDHGAQRGDAGGGLQEIQGLGRLRLVQLGGERVKIVPERNDLGRLGRVIRAEDFTIN